MLRMRRYRVFLVFAVVTVLAFYHFSGSTTWQPSTYGHGSTSSKPEEHSDAENMPVAPVLESSKAPLPPPIVQETKKVDVEIPAAETPASKVSAPAIAPVSKPVQKYPPEPLTTETSSASTTHAAAKIQTIAPAKDPQESDAVMAGDVPIEEVLAEHGEGRLEVEPPAQGEPVIHWKQLKEHFPVSSTIQLPIGSPTPIPRIQFAFKEEAAADKADRVKKLDTIKEAFTHSWEGYREHAWMRDELSPVSGDYRNPFGGWGATLVDTLDTLWIMGLKEEFAEAVKAIEKIDFTTSIRADIPLFETTIRYLGGLLAAYDMCDGQYKILLDKAVELGDVLMGAFDTPNRMPITYYQWKPTFASQPHRATSRVVLAEIGSLSVEFTRLAQLTKEPKYYDAVDRITDAFEEWQNDTKLPGMWPTYLDASGCLKPGFDPKSHSASKGPSKPVIGEPKSSTIAQTATIPSKPATKAEDASEELREATKMEPLDDKNAAFEPGKPWKGSIQGWDDSHGPTKAKRQLDLDVVESTDYTKTVPSTSGAKAAAAAGDDEEEEFEIKKPSMPVCQPQGLVSSSHYGQDTFTLGGMSDSMYEYLPKEWLLLGGLESKYQTMFEKSMDVVKEKLLFKPMTPNNADILISGVLRVSMRSTHDEDVLDESLEAEGAHLTCFTGGMFAMGAKIFNRKDDLDIAAKLTDGCIWSYEVMPTGIMPESFNALQCPADKKDCKWDEEAWKDAIDPLAKQRQVQYQQQLERMSAYEAAAKSLETAGSQETLFAIATATASEATITSTASTSSTSLAIVKPAAVVDKRQLGETALDNEERGTGTAPEAPKEFDLSIPKRKLSNSGSKASLDYMPIAPLSHEEFVQKVIEEDRVPKGMVKINARKYILRPEAIESVFYMYRITGEQHWRDAGWRMFLAIQQYTRTTYGNSAIDDVTKTAPEQLDEMESFWLAETLKYFYLLFADEDLVSLDDWVLNTEAHPFKRPDAKKTAASTGEKASI